MMRQKLHDPPALRPRRIQFGNANATSLRQQAFDRLAQLLRVGYRARSTNPVTSLWIALEHAREELAARGAVSEAQSHHLKDCIARDLNHLAALVARGPRGAIEDLHRYAARSDGALAVLLEVIDTAGGGIYRMSADCRSSAVRRAGEITCAGSISCASCRHGLRVARSWIVEPCTECGGRTFSKAP